MKLLKIKIKLGLSLLWNVDNWLPTFRDSLSGRWDRQADPTPRYTSTISNTQRRKPKVSQMYICFCGRHEGLQGLEGRRVLNLVSRCHWMIRFTPLPLYPPKRISAKREAGWATEPTVIFLENRKIPSPL